MTKTINIKNVLELKDKIVDNKRYSDNEVLDICTLAMAFENHIQSLKSQNNIMKSFIKELNTRILSEIEKDGWCRLLVDSEMVEQVQELLSNIED